MIDDIREAQRVRPDVEVVVVAIRLEDVLEGRRAARGEVEHDVAERRNRRRVACEVACALVVADHLRGDGLGDGIGSRAVVGGRGAADDGSDPRRTQPNEGEARGGDPRTDDPSDGTLPQNAVDPHRRCVLIEEPLAPGARQPDAASRMAVPGAERGCTGRRAVAGIICSVAPYEIKRCYCVNRNIRAAGGWFTSTTASLPRS